MQTRVLMMHPVIETGGWSYDDLLAWHTDILNIMSAPIRKWATSTQSQSLDSHVRAFMFFSTFAAWQPEESRPRAPDTQDAWDSMLYQRNLTELTPFNCVWLRFPDLSPAFPWRKFTTRHIWKCQGAVSGNDLNAQNLTIITSVTNINYLERNHN